MICRYWLVTNLLIAICFGLSLNSSGKEASELMPYRFINEIQKNNRSILFLNRIRNWEDRRIVEFLFGKKIVKELSEMIEQEIMIVQERWIPSVKEIIDSVISFGFVSATGRYNEGYNTWVYPSEDNRILEISWIGTYDAWMTGYIWITTDPTVSTGGAIKSREDYRSHFNFWPGVNIILGVVDEPLAENALRDFTVYILNAHKGLIHDDNAQSWSIDEIRGNAIRDGYRFFQRPKKNKLNKY